MSPLRILDVKNRKHKNVALELLWRLLKGEVKARAINIIQSKSLMEMLQDDIKRYHNKVITAADDMETLSRLPPRNRGTSRRQTRLMENRERYYLVIIAADKS